MQVLQLDASVWKTTDDFYDALFAAIGAPDWHGRLGVALVDTMFHDDINKVAPPYRVEVKHSANLPAAVKADLVQIVDLFERVRSRRRERGEYVEVSILLDSDLRNYKVVAVGTWLDSGTVPRSIAVHAKPARFASSRYDENERLDESRPVPDTKDGFLYYCWPGASGDHLTVEDAKAWTNAQSWGPVDWD